MSPEIKYILSILGISIGLIGYYPYFRDIFKWKTKPHAFSWLIWWILTGIGFAVQIHEKWGFWSWVLGTVSITCLIIAIIWFYLKQTEYHVSDWFSLVWALIALLLWWITSDPFYSVLLISFIDFLGFIPTYRKVYISPQSETLSTWYMMNIRMLIWIIALDVYSFNTIFYPWVIFLLNWVVIILIHWKRLEILKR